MLKLLSKRQIMTIEQVNRDPNQDWENINGNMQNQLPWKQKPSLKVEQFLSKPQLQLKLDESIRAWAKLIEEIGRKTD